MNNRRRAIVNIVPSKPPNVAMMRVSIHWMLVQMFMTSRAGTVKITPAASDSPAEAIV